MKNRILVTMHDVRECLEVAEQLIKEGDLAKAEVFAEKAMCSMNELNLILARECAKMQMEINERGL